MICRFLSWLLTGIWLLIIPVSSAAEFPLKLDTHPVELSPHTSPDAAIGRIRSLGMLEIPSIKIRGMRLSLLSALAWDEDEGLLYALSDKGSLFHLRPELKNERL